MKKILCGCGYLGWRVAKLWHARGDQVFVTTRGRDKAAELAAAGCVPLVFDVASAEGVPSEAARGLPADADTLLVALGFDRSPGQQIEELYPRALGNLLAAAPSGLRRVIYISSTGVHGGAGGDWIDESAPCLPARPGGRASLAAENLLRASRFADRAIVLRLAGIYGPGRVPHRDALQTGQPIPAPSAGWLNLIHVDDAAAAVLAAEQLPPPRLYLVSDGAPVLRGDYYAEAARRLGAPPPRFVDPPADDPAARRAENSRRVNSARFPRDAGLQWKYPTYREGLASILE